ncbi:transposase [Streptomyces sp. 900105755]
MRAAAATGQLPDHGGTQRRVTRGLRAGLLAPVPAGRVGGDHSRRGRAGIPGEIRHADKWMLALELFDQVVAWGLKPRTVVVDSTYGRSAQFRRALQDRGLDFMLSVPRRCSPSRKRGPWRKATTPTFPGPTPRTDATPTEATSGSRGIRDPTCLVRVSARTRLSPSCQPPERPFRPAPGPVRKVRCSPSGLRVPGGRTRRGSPIFRGTARCSDSSNPPKGTGESSSTIMRSRRVWAWATSRAVAGAAGTTT